MQSTKRSKSAIFLAWIPALLIMVVIFLFSAKEADISANTSSKIVDMIIDLLKQLTDIRIQSGTPDYELLHTTIRKLGHLTEFAALGMSLLLPYYFLGKQKLQLVLYSELTAIIYACSDEFHQLFVKGRDGNLIDVGIDSFGALLGIGFSLVILKLIQKHVDS